MNEAKKQLQLYTKVFFEQGAFQVDHLTYPARAKAVGMGVLRRYFFYRRCVDQMVKPDTNNSEKAYLMVCFFQLDESNEIERQTHACVDVAEQCGINKGFVNAVLRRYLKQRESLKTKFRGDPSVQFNLCPQLLNILKKDHKEWRQIISVMRTQPNVCLVINTQSISREDFEAKLKLKGIEFSSTLMGVALKQAIPIKEVPGYQEGWFWVQSESNQQLKQLLPNTPPVDILDMCAAPGGKTAMLSIIYPNAKVTATDVDPSRIERLKENKQRLGLSFEIEQVDWATHSSEKQYDLIWLDVPCSSTGVISKHPEIGVSTRAWGLNHSIQQKLILQAWMMLRPGGHLVYSTCSVLHSENTEMVQMLLNKEDANLMSLTAISALDSNKGCYFTSKNSCDFVYGALVQKNIDV